MPAPSDFDLRAVADQAMRENGFEPHVPPAVLAEVAAAASPGPGSGGESAAASVLDLRQLPWSSIDNDESRDLDQLEVAERLEGDGGDEVRVRVAIADVDATVKRGSATDRFAAENATSVYAGAATYPMLPERLSTDLTSLGQDAERLTVVIEFVVAGDGTTRAHDVYRARVTNRAKLAYGSVGPWLEGRAGAVIPPAAAAAPEIADQLRLQDEVARRLRAVRARAGALDLGTVEARAVVGAGGAVEVEAVRKNRASALIEDFMIAANVAMAQFLDERGTPSIRRVVRTPERWDRIVALAAALGERLPPTPDAPALAAFLDRRRTADPDHFPDLSLSVVKLLGPGEYALHVPRPSSGATPGAAPADDGHFGLAAPDYTHGTAPNRRYADLVTQRLLKAALAGAPPPYSDDELTGIARHCTEREDAARKVERRVRKAAAAVAMARRVGETFDAIVTGVTPKGTFVRVVAPPVEGRVVRGEHGLDVGDAVRVTLLSADPSRGYVDFGV